MKAQRGDIVLVNYPYSDRTGSKTRPCVVVQNDANNQKLDDTIVVLITSRIQHVHTERSQVLIDVTTPSGKQTGILFTSAVLCENIATIDCQFLYRKIGVMPADLMRQIDDALKAALALP